MHVEDEDIASTCAALEAVLATSDIVLDRPIGDGNGRRARLIEIQLMVQAGVPIPAADLLSDFYSKTRDADYRARDRTRRRPYRRDQFIYYAVRGFDDECRAVPIYSG